MNQIPAQTTIVARLRNTAALAFDTFRATHQMRYYSLSQDLYRQAAQLEELDRRDTEHDLPF